MAYFQSIGIANLFSEYNEETFLLFTSPVSVRTAKLIALKYPLDEVDLGIAKL